MCEEDQQWYREWLATGRLECSDCGTRLKVANLETLPAHRCTERQAARRARASSQ
jgi:hypothetical protein